MDSVLRGLPFLFVYLDDILIASASPSEHLGHVKTVLKRLAGAGLSINREKCCFGVPEVDFLGHRVTPSGISPLPKKVYTIVAMEQPASKVELQRFLGCINFFHRFIPHLAAVLAPLHALVSSVKTPSAKLSWTPSLVTSFKNAKSALISCVHLTHPSQGPSVPLSLTTDASDIAVGAVLAQGDSQQPVGFYSKKLSESEKKYSAFDKELLALYLSIRHFRCHLEGRPFTVWTDHKPLCGPVSYTHLTLPTNREV